MNSRSLCHPQHQDEVVNTILAWWDRKQRGLLENGIWLPSQKTKM